MSRTWTSTDLSTTPAYYEMAVTDQRTFGYNATTGTIGVTTEIIRLDTQALVTGILDPPVFDSIANRITVLVIGSGMTRGLTYRLSIIEHKPNNGRETATTVIGCVA
jgi:hypothetical protein